MSHCVDKMQNFRGPRQTGDLPLPSQISGRPHLYRVLYVLIEFCLCVCGWVLLGASSSPLGVKITQSECRRRRFKLWQFSPWDPEARGKSLGLLHPDFKGDDHLVVQLISWWGLQQEAKRQIELQIWQPGMLLLGATHALRGSMPCMPGETPTWKMT